MWMNVPTSGMGRRRWRQLKIIKRIISILLKQYSLGQGIGAFRDLLGRSLFYISVINFALISVTAFNTTVRDYVAQYVSWFSFPIFIFLLILVAFSAMVLEYKLVLPSNVNFANRQIYKHKNPIKDDLLEIKGKLDKLEKMIKDSQELRKGE